MDTRAKIRRVFMLSLFVLVLFDGGAHHFGASVALVLFSGTLAATIGDVIHRPELRRIQVSSLLVVFAVIALAVWQTRWTTDPTIFHPNWKHLAEQFAEIGGTRSVSRSQPLWEIAGTILPFVAFAAAVSLFRRRHAIDEALTSLVFIGVIFATYGVLQTLFFPDWHFFNERTAYGDSLSGFYVNRNSAAAFLTMTLMTTLVTMERQVADTDALALRRSLSRFSGFSPSQRRILLFSCFFVVQLLALMLTRSRAGVVLGLCEVSAFLLAFAPRHLDRMRLRFSRTRAVVLLALVAVTLSGLAAQTFHRLDVQGGEDGRWCIYPAVVRMIGDNLPWGVGLGGFRDGFASYRPPDCGLVGVWENAHDSYLQGFATLGVVFGVALVAFTALSAPPLLRGLRRDGRLVALTTAVVLVSIGLALHSLIDFSLEIPGNFVTFGLLVISAIGQTGVDTRTSHRTNDRRSPSHTRSGMSRRPARKAAVTSGEALQNRHSD